MNTADIALARLAALPGSLPRWLGPAAARLDDDPDPAVGLVYQAALETAGRVGQWSLEEFLR